MSVADAFNACVSEDRQRDKSKLMRKFQTLWQKSMPTGDPHIPPDVLRAKRLNQQIIQDAELVDAEDMSPESGEVEETEEEDDVPAEELGDNNKSTDAPTNVMALPKPASRSLSITSTTSATNSRKARSSQGKSQSAATETSEILKAFIKTEKMNAKRERDRAKKREKREKKQFKMMFGMMTTAIVAFGGKKAGKQMERLAESSSSSDSSDESLISVDSSDSPPYKRKKLERQHKKLNQS
jgi:hypothetical protein